ncbi:MAG TPA: RAMP superfamily CRISPR-associated protein [Saprospiraceae bacterium]|nr:CRISPR-associated protein [Saprospirales bacterium]HRQ28799.1 RAMP superfamily CRISPR-associated protein [Saprospiraceae bacterium]
MIEIKYSIEFLSDWMCSSGLGAGAETDNEVIKDKNGLPYIPGRTIKGLLRDACEEMAEFSMVEFPVIDHLFGKRTEKDKHESTPGSIKVSNASLPEKETQEIIEHSMQEYLYRNVASTAIDDKGIAKTGSLRMTEVCIPIKLEGSIHIAEKYKTTLENAMKWTRRIGTNRNRGLGRCIISLK